MRHSAKVWPGALQNKFFFTFSFQRCNFVQINVLIPSKGIGKNTQNFNAGQRLFQLNAKPLFYSSFCIWQKGKQNHFVSTWNIFSLPFQSVKQTKNNQLFTQLWSAIVWLLFVALEHFQKCPSWQTWALWFKDAGPERGQGRLSVLQPYPSLGAGVLFVSPIPKSTGIGTPQR